MKNLPALLMLTLIAVSAVSAGQDVCVRAEKLFRTGELPQGRLLLIEALDDSALSPRQRGRVAEKLARFHEIYVGDLDKALGLYRTILTMPGLPEEGPLRKAARAHIRRVMRDKERVSPEDLLLRRVRVEVNDRAELKDRVDALRAVVRTNQKYPRLAEIYYYLGTHLLALEHYHRAYDALDRALELRPGMGFANAVESRKRLAYQRWMHALLWRTVRVLLSLLLAGAAVGLFCARPWQWVGLRHVALLAALLVLWCGVFAFMMWSSRHPPAADPLEFGGGPAFVNSSWTSPGAAVLWPLFLTGVIGVVGAFVLSVSAVSIRLPWTRAAVALTAGAVLFACVVSVFFLTYCYNDAQLDPIAESGLPAPGTTMYFVLPDVEPFMLSDPKKYPGLDIDSADDPYLRRWLRDMERKMGPRED